MDKIPLNFQIIGNPVNWVIVILMLAIATLGFTVIFHPKS